MAHCLLTARVVVLPIRPTDRRMRSEATDWPLHPLPRLDRGTLRATLLTLAILAGFALQPQTDDRTATAVQSAEVVEHV